MSKSAKTMKNYENNDPKTIKRDIEYFQLLPEELSYCQLVDKDSTRTSMIWDTGRVVRNEKDQCFWYCLASDECKDKRKPMSLSTFNKMQISNCTRHLRVVHGISSARSQAMSANKERRAGAVNDIKSSEIFSSNKTLALEFSYALVVVGSMVPHRLVETEDMRLFLDVACVAEMNKELHSTLVNQRIIEIYHSLKQQMKKRLKKDLESATIPLLHLLFDEWWCKQLCQRFIAVRVRYVDGEFNMVTLLLSVRLYDRSKVDEDLGTASQILHEWTKGILHEFGLSISQVYSATTDAGPDVRCMADKLMQVKWEWCVPHMLCKAVQEACGLMRSQRSGSEQQCIRQIIRTSNRVIDGIRNSNQAISALNKLIKSSGRPTRVVLKYWLEIRFMG